jgi:hypothetical protein
MRKFKKKSKPSWLILLGSFILSFLLSLVIFEICEKQNKYLINESNAFVFYAQRKDGGDKDIFEYWVKNDSGKVGHFNSSQKIAIGSRISVIQRNVH